MSKKKNLKWICRRCMKTHPEVKVEHSAEILRDCDFCGVGNWCFPVTSSRPVKGGKKAPKEPESGTNTTDTLVYDEIAPAETAPEAESTEENEAVEEVAEEALEEILEEIAPEEKAPEETPPEAEPEPLIMPTIITEKIIEQPLEAESEPSAESITETLDILKTIEQGDDYRKLMIDPKADVTAEIARLEAKLAKLKPAK